MLGIMVRTIGCKSETVLEDLPRRDEVTEAFIELLFQQYLKVSKLGPLL